MRATRQRMSRPDRGSPRSFREGEDPQYMATGEPMGGLGRLGLALGFLLLLTGCAGTHKSLPPLPPATVGEYLLDSGDKVLVTVFAEPRLNGTYVVTDSGSIAMPLLGPIEARGLTVARLGAAIGSKLQQGFVVNPGVSVQIDQHRPFFILGEVERPGQYPYVEGMTVLTGVAIGGGFTFRAEKVRMSVTRTVSGEKKEYSGTRDSIVLPGDVVYIFEKYI